jgi:tRNA threonylcarbamoyladenosine biosynthesis protein TsaE
MELMFKLDEIDHAAEQFIASAGHHRVFTFSGQMGAGKTTFICALCRHLGVQEVQGSPTFSIINDYLTKSGIQIYHMDLYRINGTQEAIAAGVEDALMQGRYSFVEWPEMAHGLFGEEVVRCEIGLIDENQRILKINL